MDIQQMVNARIEELRNQALGKSSSENTTRSQNQLTPAYRVKLEELSSVMDETLTTIACRILEIAEQVSGDYARLEKELLNSRLALLQSAETVLDMALSLKSQARKVIDSGLMQDPPQGDPATLNEERAFEAHRGQEAYSLAELSETEPPSYSARSWEIEQGCPVCSGRSQANADGIAGGAGRASMMSNGVADLFRKTQN